MKPVRPAQPAPASSADPVTAAVAAMSRALQQLELTAEKARNHESDAGYLSVMNLRMNFLNDPLVTPPRFADVLARMRGD